MVLRTKIRTLLGRPGYRYVLVGGSVYIFELLIIIVAQSLGASALLAVGLSFWLGFLVSFSLQKFIAFGDKRTHRKVIVPQFVAICLLVLFNFGFTLFMTRLFAHLMSTLVTRTLALGVTTLWNFYFYRTRVFAHTPIISQLID